MSTDEYKAFIQGRLGVQDWSALPLSHISAHQNGLKAMAWLKTKANDSLRGGRPLQFFSQAVAPFLEYNYVGKVCEFFDPER
eukprot:12406737-Karenia_brevis.AAC.1